MIETIGTPDQNPSFTTSRQILKEKDVEGIWMSTNEWERIFCRVREIREPVQWFRNLGWGLALLVPTGILASWTWHPIYSAMEDAEQLANAWVGTAINALVIAAALGALLCWVANRTFQNEITRDKRHVLDLMLVIGHKHGLSAPPEQPRSGLVAGVKRVLRIGDSP